MAKKSKNDANLLKFGKGNAKLKDTFTFSLPAGWTCPGASECLSRANREDGTVKDGPETQFRCFAATMEARPTVREARWFNLEMVKDTLKKSGVEGLARLILASLPKKAKRVRIHVSGDFFSAAYFLAWCQAAAARPDVLFYAYTKSIKVWQDNNAAVPANLILTASVGGREDDLIEAMELRRAVVVFSEMEAQMHGLAIDHDDSLAMNPDVRVFALLIHGTQPAGTPAAAALRALKAAGDYGYGEKADKIREERRKALPTV